MYTARYINPMFQLKVRSWRMVLEDDAGVYPTIVVEKSFRRAEATVLALRSYATDVASIAMSQFDPPEELFEPVPCSIDIPAGKEMTP